MDGVPWNICKKQGGWTTDRTPQRYGALDDEEMDYWYDEIVEQKIAVRTERLEPERAEGTATQESQSFEKAVTAETSRIGPKRADGTRPEKAAIELERS
jgi:hypothetical protein